MVFYSDRETADRHTATVKQAILKELKGAYNKMETVERFSYGRDSCFCDSESKSEPEQGGKRQRVGEEAARSNQQARKD